MSPGTLTTLKLVTIVAETILENEITEALRPLGARGFTVTECRGQGTRGMRPSELPGQGVRIETIVTSAAAEKIVEHISAHYFAHFSVVCFVSDVQVVRGDKYREEGA